TTQSIDPARRSMPNRVDQVQDLQDRENGEHDADREDQAPPEERPPPTDLQPFGQDQPGHSDSSSLEVISRNLASSETRTGDSSKTEMPAETSERLISAAKRFASSASTDSETISESSSDVALSTPGKVPSVVAAAEAGSHRIR